MQPNIRMNVLKVLTILLVLGMVLTGAQPQSGRAFAGNTALAFDGVNDYVFVQDADPGSPGTVYMNELMGDGAGGEDPNWHEVMTVSVWVKPTENATVGGPGAGDIVVGNNPRWFGIEYVNTGTGNQMVFFNADGSIDTITTPVTVGEWVHLAWVHNGTSLLAYKNGMLVNSRVSGSTLEPAVTGCTRVDDCTQFSYGAHFLEGNQSGTQYFRGEIDEVAVWNAALSVSEIRAWMHKEVTAGHPQAAALRMYFKNDDSAGSYAANSAPGYSRYRGTAVNAPAWVASGAFAGPDNAIDPDGVPGDWVSVPNTLSMPAQLTLEASIFPRDLSAGTRWIVGEAGGARLVSNGSTLEFYIHDGSSLVGPATATLAATTWQHVAGTYDGTTLQVYVDGFAGTPFSAAGSNTDQGGVFGMASPDGTTQLNTLSIDEVRLWDTARAQAAIQQTMYRTLDPSSANLVAYYRFDQVGTSGQTTVYDQVGSNNGSINSMNATTDWVASAAFNTWIGDESTDWNTPGNWSRNLVPGSTSNVGIFNYPLSNHPGFSAAVTVYNLFVDSGASLEIVSGGSLTADSFLYNYGTLELTQNIDGSTEVGFFNTGSYGGVLIEPNGENLGDTTVEIRGYQDCTAVAGETVIRCFDITPTSLPVTNGSTITFFFDDAELESNDCNDLNAFHWTGSGWALQTLDTSYATGGRQCATSPYSLRITDVLSYSPFVIKGPGNPTAIQLTAFEVSSGQPVIWVLTFAGIGLLAIGLGIYLKTRKQLGN